MARHIIRDDEFWSVVIIWTPLVRQMANVGQEGHKSALHIFVHELVHVDERGSAGEIVLLESCRRRCFRVQPSQGITCDSGPPSQMLTSGQARKFVLPRF